MGFPFYFIKYINPTCYFNLHKFDNSHSYFLDIDKIDDDIKSKIKFDNGYSSNVISKIDAAFQLYNSGLIVLNTNFQLEMRNIIPTVSDNYRFVRKNFHYGWSYFILFLRLLSFKNPFIEIISFLKNIFIIRNKSCENDLFPITNFNDFESCSLVAFKKVSIVIPTLNRYDYLKEALMDLENQSYKEFEVLIVDQSDPFQPYFYNQFNLNIKLIRQEEKALWLARNTAIEKSTSDLIVMFEDDVRVDKDWLKNHIKCLDYFNVDISAGVFYPEGSSIPKNRSYFKWAEQFATGNACIKKHVFQKIGLFDRVFERQRMGDAEFGFRAYLNGFKSISNPLSYCLDIKAPVGGLREKGGSWDSFRPKNIWDPRPVPSVLYVIRKYFGKRSSLYTILFNIPLSLLPYKLKRKSYLLPFYFILHLPILPLIFLQVIKSWNISTVMLRNGSKIDYL